MKFLRNTLDKYKHNFEKGGKWERFYYAFEAIDTFAFAPNLTAQARGAHIRDAMDMKRLMITVIISMVPALLFGMYNVGYQHFLAIGEQAVWMDMFLVGLKQVLPVIVVSYGVGLGIEFLFAILRR